MRSDTAMRIVPQSAIVVEGVLQQVDDADVRLVRFLYCDYAGIIRTKVVHRANLERKLTEGIGVTLAQSALNVRDELIDIPEMPPVDEVRLVPDPSTFTVLPWVEAGGSIVASLLDRSREPWFGCTRSLLRRQIAAAEAAGFSVEATFENEYYVYRRSDEGDDIQPERLPVYSSIGFDEYNALLLETVDALTGSWRSRCATGRRCLPRMRSSRCATRRGGSRCATATAPASPPSPFSTRSAAAPTCTCRSGTRAAICCTTRRRRAG
jgi:hypothetical protein